MIVIQNKFIPLGGYKIINLCGVLFVKGNTISPEEYHDVSFEEEAHNNDKDLGYLKTRKVFQYRWFKYVRVNSAK